MALFNKHIKLFSIIFSINNKSKKLNKHPEPNRGKTKEKTNSTDDDEKEENYSTEDALAVVKLFLVQLVEAFVYSVEEIKSWVLDTFTDTDTQREREREREIERGKPTIKPQKQKHKHMN